MCCALSLTGWLVHVVGRFCYRCVLCFCFQAEDGIRDLVRSRGLGDVYKRQEWFIFDKDNELRLRKYKHGFYLFEDGEKLPPYKLSLIHI